MPSLDPKVEEIIRQDILNQIIKYCNIISHFSVAELIGSVGVNLKK